MLPEIALDEGLTDSQIHVFGLLLAYAILNSLRSEQTNNKSGEIRFIDTEGKFKIFKRQKMKFQDFLEVSALLIFSNNISIFAALLCICIENPKRGAVLSTTLGLGISTA